MPLPTRPVLAALGLLATLALVTTPTAAADEVAFTIEAHQGENRFYFASPDGEENPTLDVKPGDTVTLNVEFVSGFHNLRVDAPVSVKTDYGKEGTSESLTFTIPEDAPAVIAYWCDPHRANGMEGILAVEGGRPVEAATPFVAPVLAVLAVAGVAVGLRGRAPRR